MTEPLDIIIGIDLGTTNSLAAVVGPEGPEALSADADGPIVPSVAARVQGRWVVGRPALGLRTQAPEHTVFSVKRLMGRDMADLQAELPRLPYGVEAAQRGLVQVVLGQERYTPQEISAVVLQAVKAKAEAALGHAVHKAVLTVPAYFDDAQRQATRDAGRIAGLEVVRIINEPTAAAVAYGLDQRDKGLVAVYDLGGGTFDISLLQLSQQVFKVLATHGDTHLGGDDMDHLLADELARRTLLQHPQARLDTPGERALLLGVAESIKMELTRAQDTPYTLDFTAQGLTHSGVFTRQTLEALILPLVERTLDSCRQALALAGKETAQVDEVVLVGGATRIPLVRHRVEAFFGRRPNVALDPDLVVAMGAAVQGHLLAGGRRDYVLLDVVPLALGLETLGGAFSKLITANTTIPAQATEHFTTSVDGQTAVELNIYQGEREFVKDCRNLGRFKLQGLPPMPAGLPKMAVTFLVDANGILTVSAREERSGQEAHIEVIPSHGLTPHEVERMVEEAVDNAREDMTLRQLVEFRLTAQAVFQGIDKAWPQAEKLLSAAEQAQVRAQMEVVRQAALGSDPILLKAEMDKLGQLTRPLADTLISQAALVELKAFVAEHRQENTP